MRQLAQRVKRIRVTVGQEPQWSRRLPADGQIFPDQAEGRSRATAMHPANDAEAIRSARSVLSQAVSDFVDRSGQGLVLRRESLCELTAVTLALSLESGQVFEFDAAITANAVGHDLTSIQELVQVRTTHAKTLSGLARSEHGRSGGDCEIAAITHATAEAQQHIA